MKINPRIAGFFCASLLSTLAISAALSAEELNPEKTRKMPPVADSCRKICPTSHSDKDAFECVEKYEKLHGDASLKGRNKACYEAHEKYEDLFKKSESVSPGDEPYRYG